MKSLLLPAATLEILARDLLVAMGAPPDTATRVARSLIGSDMRESHTHGLALLPIYASMVNGAAIDPQASPSVQHKTDTIIQVDGHCAFGQITGECATAAGIEAAKRSGMALVAIKNGAHLGRLGEWAGQAATAGLVFSAYTNTEGGALNVAAFGGQQRKLSTNPVAFAVPTFAALPFNIIADFATSQVSGSVMREYYRIDRRPHDEWTTSTTGEPVSDALAFMNGEGAILPLGGRATGHKGYALAIFAELLGGIAGGMVIGQHQPRWFSNAGLFSFFDPLHFVTVEELETRIRAIVAHLDEENVRLPGEGAHARATRAEAQGVTMQTHVMQSLVRLATDLGVELDAEIAVLAGDDETGVENLISW